MRMSKRVERDIEFLKKEILALGAMVEESINISVRSFLDRGSDMTGKVLENDRQINEREVSIEEECLKTLALYQPVAGKLRFIIVALKVNNYLERMGDLAVNIAKRAKYLSRKDELDVDLDFAQMAQKVDKMVKSSLDAFINSDTSIARGVLNMDDEVDALYRKMHETLQNVMIEDSGAVKRAVNMLSTSRYLERIADLATNIAEEVVFLVDGEFIRHRTEDYLDSLPD